jgi:raffinose synthase
MNKHWLNRSIFLLLTCCLMSACSRQPDAPLRLSAVDQNAVLLTWEGKTRLQGGVPLLEGRDLGPLHVKASPDADETTYAFSGDQTPNPVTVKVRQLGKPHILSLHLSPNGQHAGKGEHFVGFFFDELPGYLRGTAFYRYGPVKAWTKPLQVKDPGQTESDDIQFMLWQYQDSTYAAAMPLGGQGYNATLGSENGKFGVKSVSLVDGVEASDIPLLAIGFGTDPYALIDELYEEGLRLMGRSENLRKHKTFPEQLEYLGWCTWNGLGWNLSEQKILAGAATFTQNNFPLPFLLIDDGWQKVNPDNGRLISFKADEAKFPKGLRPVIDRLKQEHGVRDVGVWHTLNGYWAGVGIDSELGQQYRDLLMPYQDKITWTDNPIETFYAPTAQSDAGFRFYDDWYTYLKGQGISLVKVDNQLIIDRLARGNVPLWEAGKHAQGNLQRAVQKHFGGAVINCMDMTTNSVYHFGSSAVARNSEDYFPKQTSYNIEKGNAAVHVLSVLYNSLWFSPMVWPDFDMFQSHHPQGEYHAVARAISGGPVYLTDTPGQQNFDLLRKLVYRDGRVIRADEPARPTRDCLFQVQDPQPFKAFSRSGQAGLLGIWHAADAEDISGYFRPSDVEGLEGRQFAVYDHATKEMRVATPNEAFPVRLPRMGHKLYLIVPVAHEVALLGLTNKYNAPKTILSQDISQNEFTVTLPEGGTFGAYLPRAPRQVEVDGQVQPSGQYTWRGGLFELALEDNPTLKERKVRVVLE